VVLTVPAVDVLRECRRGFRPALAEEDNDVPTKEKNNNSLRLQIGHTISISGFLGMKHEPPTLSEVEP
jgi:hypothetical protein